MTASALVIAIDGPAGSGKSTVARAVAQRLGLPYLDTGAMYRSVAFAVLRHGLDPEDDDPVGRLAQHIEIAVEHGVVTVDGVDASVEIRGPEVTRAVSAVARNSSVRDELRRRQRAWVEVRGGGVVEGRDIGTVVFPEATVKIYLTASHETRAGRRANEVAELSLEAVAADIARRDHVDSTRVDSPLLAADDAVVLDTTDLGIDQAVQAVLDRVEARR